MISLYQFNFLEVRGYDDGFIEAIHYLVNRHALPPFLFPHAFNDDLCGDPRAQARWDSL